MTGSIVLQVCEEFEISPKAFFGSKQNKKLVIARRVAIARFMRADFSMAGIARVMKRDYSTIRYWAVPGYREVKRARCLRRKAELREAA